MTELATRVVQRYVEAAEKAANAYGTPLYGHTNEATAYVVDDYPYGFRLRTQIRYWLESAPKKGWRFVSQTMNPKSGRWNAPKKSTYMEWAGAMYLDHQGHVHWTGLGAYTKDEDFDRFVKAFPQADLSIVRYVTKAKIKHLEGMIAGTRFFTLNNEKIPMSEEEIGKKREELEWWQDFQRRL